MDGDQKFWVTIWTLAFVTLMSIIAAAILSGQIDDARMERLLLAKVPANQAYCAMHAGGSSTLCGIILGAR